MEIEKLLNQAKKICKKRVGIHRLERIRFEYDFACENCPLKLNDSIYGCFKIYLKIVLDYPDKIALLNEEIKENE